MPGWTNFNLDSGLELDVLAHLSNFPEETVDYCLSFASKAKIFELEIPFLHLNQLLEEKRKTNGPKDQIEVLELEKI